MAVKISTFIVQEKKQHKTNHKHQLKYIQIFTAAEANSQAQTEHVGLF